jgi:uncharacterized protein Yka (UPF0111/DUF47 family)
MSFGRTFKALTRSNDRRFVALLSQQAELTVRALQVLEKFGPEAADNNELVDQLKEIEREGDAARRILIDELLHTYATPFDREDLFGLSRAIDDILDAANETAIELAMYRIGPPAGLIEMAKVLTEILKSREIYRHLKNSADRIDRTADEISVIVIKRS